MQCEFYPWKQHNESACDPSCQQNWHLHHGTSVKSASKIYSINLEYTKNIQQKNLIYTRLSLMKICRRHNKVPPEKCLLCIWAFNTIDTFLTYFIPLVIFHNPLKHDKDTRFSNVFRGYRKRPVACNELIYWFDF